MKPLQKVLAWEKSLGGMVACLHENLYLASLLLTNKYRQGTIESLGERIHHRFNSDSLDL